MTADRPGARATRSNALLDACAVGGASLAYVVLESFGLSKRWSFAVLGVAVNVYAVHLLRRRSPSWRELGFRTDNLRSAAWAFGAFTAVAAAALIGWGVVRGATPSLSTVALLLALYPVWALVQQTAFQGLLHRSLESLIPAAPLQVLVTSVAFAAVHAGDARLVSLTFAAGLAWSLLYRRWPNLWALAASHTLLAALAYPLVTGDDPLSRL